MNINFPFLSWICRQLLYKQVSTSKLCGHLLHPPLTLGRSIRYTWARCFTSFRLTPLALKYLHDFIFAMHANNLSTLAAQFHISALSGWGYRQWLRRVIAADAHHRQMLRSEMWDVRTVVIVSRPPLWSSGQSFWLQIQRSRVRFPALPDFSE